MLAAPGKSLVLNSGNVNSSTWSPGVLGFNGQVAEETFTADLSALVGKVANIRFEVRDVGDMIVDSGLAIDGLKVVRTQQYNPAGGGVLNSNVRRRSPVRDDTYFYPRERFHWEGGSTFLFARGFMHEDGITGSLDRGAARTDERGRGGRLD